MPTQHAADQQSTDPSSYVQARLRSLPTFARELIAGGVAGGLAKTCVAPLERTKIIFQTRGGQLTVQGVLHYIWKREGVQGLFRGNTASVLRIVPYAAIHFGLYEYYRRGIISMCLPGSSPGSKEQGIPLWDLLAGSASGASAVVATYPLDLVRTRLAWATETPAPTATVAGTGQSVRQPGIVALLVTTAKDEGLIGMYRGVVPTLLGILPYAGLKFYVYQALKNRYRMWAADSGRSSTGLQEQSADCALQQQQQQLPQERHSLGTPEHSSNDNSSSSCSSAVVVQTVNCSLELTANKLLMDDSSDGGEQHGNSHNLLHDQYQQQEQQQQQQQQQQHTKLPVTATLLFGGAAGLVAQTVTYPLDVIRRQLQVAHLKRSAFLKERMLDLQGTSGGGSSSSSSNAPSGPRTTAVGSHCSSSRSVRNSSNCSNRSAMPLQSQPAAAHCSSSSSSNKWRSAAQGGGRHGTLMRAHAQRYSSASMHDILHPKPSMWVVTRALVAEGGVHALFRGLSINYLKVVPSTAIGFTVYDVLKSYLGLASSL